MSDISQWFPTADGNNAQDVPDAAVEGETSIADLNNCDREAQAAVRRDFEAPEWKDRGDTVASNGTGDITLNTTVRGTYIEGQRIRVTDTGAGSALIYGTIADFTSPVIQVSIDAGGSYVGPLTEISVGTDPTGDPTFKQDYVKPAADGNLAMLDLLGQVQDSGSLIDSDTDLTSDDNVYDGTALKAYIAAQIAAAVQPIGIGQTYSSTSLANSTPRQNGASLQSMQVLLEALPNSITTTDFAISIYCDANATPTTKIATIEMDADDYTQRELRTISFIVPPDFYYMYTFTSSLGTVTVTELS